MKESLLFVLRASVLDPRLVRESLSEVLTFAAYDVPVALLLLDATAILAFHRGFDRDLIGMMDVMPLYGVVQIWVEAEALSHLSADPSDIRPGVSLIQRADLEALFSQYGRVFGVSNCGVHHRTSSHARQ